MQTQLSLRGLWMYDKTIFDNMVLPDGVDREVLIDNLLTEYDELEVLYSDPSFFKRVLGNWSKQRLWSWQKIYDTLNFEYNPIHNYDRHEEWEEYAKGKEVLDRSTSNDTDVTRKSSEDGSATTDENWDVDTDTSNTRTLNTTKTDNSTVTNYVVGYNGVAETMHDKQVSSGTSKDNGTITDISDATENGDRNIGNSYDRSVSETEGVNNTGTLNDVTDSSHENSHKGYLYGNIGVTTTQQMIESEREVSKFDIYEYISNDIAQRFLLLIY